MMGREAQDGQMSVLLVVSVAWFIFGSVVVVVNQVTYHMMSHFVVVVVAVVVVVVNQVI